MHKSWFGLLVLAVVAMTAAASMAAQQSDFKLSSAEWQMRQKTNEGVIRIIADDVDSTSFRAAAEVSSVLNGLEGLRVIPVVGRGSVSNINDLLFVKEIDLSGGAAGRARPAAGDARHSGARTPGELRDQAL